MSFDLRRAEPGRPSVITWLVAVPFVVFAFLVVAVATETSAVMRLDLRGLGVLDLLAQLLRAHEELLLLVALGLGDELAEVLLLAADRLVRRDRGSSLLVRTDQLVDELGGLASTVLGSAYGVGVVSQDSGVNHRLSLSPDSRPFFSPLG